MSSATPDIYSDSLPSGDEPPKPQIRVTVPSRWYVLPGAAVLIGSMIGLRRGARTTALRFLAENVHRPPTTVQGWYFYNKTKNYRVLMGGLKEAGREAGKLGATAAVWVGLEEGCRRLGHGLDEASEVVAGVGTAAVFSGAYRLPWTAARRALGLGVVVGAVLSGLRWGQEALRAQAQAGVRAEGEA